MRPDPQRRRKAPETGQIIYIGDVRRRRGPRKQTPDRYFLAAIGLVAAMGWGAWITVLMSLPPSRLLSYLAFFIPLAVALTGTGTIAIYTFQWWRGAIGDLWTSARQAFLATAVVEVNLGFLGARLWLIAIAAASIAAAVMIEVTMWSRSR
jgi:hypothetical protein